MIENDVAAKCPTLYSVPISPSSLVQLRSIFRNHVACDGHKIRSLNFSYMASFPPDRPRYEIYPSRSLTMDGINTIWRSHDFYHRILITLSLLILIRAVKARTIPCIHSILSGIKYCFHYLKKQTIKNRIRRHNKYGRTK